MSKRLSSVASMICIKCALMFLNILVLIDGLVLLCVGIFLRIELHSYMEDAKDESGAIFIIVAGFGGILVVACVLACCCITKERPALLYLYGAFLAVLAILELGAGASLYVYRFNIKGNFEEVLNTSMTSYGIDPAMTKNVDVVQSKLKCCGNRGYRDWLNLHPQKEVPVSCCKVPHGECDTTDPEDIYTLGCYQFVMAFVSESAFAVFETVKTAIVLIFGVTLCCLANNITKKKDELIVRNNHRAQHLP